MNKIGLRSAEHRDGLEPNVDPPVTSEYEWRLNAYLSGSALSNEQQQITAPLDARHTAPPSISSRRSSSKGFHKRLSIAESIVDSFGLQNNEDNLSYISGFLSCSSYHMGAGHVNDGYSCHGDFDDDIESNYIGGRPHGGKDIITVRCSSCDSLSALHNDQFYPPALNHCDGITGTPDCEPRRRRKRRRSWKRSVPSRPKIYTVQMPKDPHVLATSGKAVTRTIRDERQSVAAISDREYIMRTPREADYDLPVMNRTQEDTLYNQLSQLDSVAGNIGTPFGDNLDITNCSGPALDDAQEVALAEEVIQQFQNQNNQCDANMDYVRGGEGTNTPEGGTFV